MIQPSLPPDEEKRLATLRSLKILDTPPEERFDRITRIAAQVFQVPVVLISLVDADRQWFKSRQGIHISQTPRAVSFCGHAILGNDVLIVRDTILDPRFSDNPLVKEELLIRFYAGCPLIAWDGSKLGTLCIIDRIPRQLNPEEVEVLRDLAAVVQNELTAGQMNHLLAERENLLQTIVDTEPESIKLVNADGTLLSVNPAGLAMIEFDSLEQAVGESFYPLVKPKDRPAFKNLVRDGFRGSAGKLEFEIVGLKGTRRILEAHTFPLRNSGNEIIALLAVTRDITKHKQAEEALRISEELFRQFAENIQEIFWMTDLRISRLIYISPSYEKITGHSCESLYKNPRAFLEIIHPDDRARLLSALEKQEWGDKDEVFRFIKPDKTIRWMRNQAFPIKNERGEIYRIAGIAEDITERKRDEETIRHLAYYDALTDLPNRALLRDRLQQAILIGLREKKPLTLLLMDLNRFKEINDTLGHHKGDFVLKQVGERLKQVVRESDTVSRLGGDEFAVLLPGVGDIEYASLVARKILEELESPFMVDGLALEVGTSIGIAFFPDHAEDVNLLIQKADVAMYAAKEAGLGYIFYTPERDRDTAPRLALVGELRSAIENEELQLFYQPKISLKTGRVLAFEALARWRHISRGLIMPDEFIPLAEQTGLTNMFTQWAVNEALHQLQLWHQSGIDIPIAINLSTRILQNEGLPQLIYGLLSKWNIGPERFKLEITESAIMSDPILALKTLGSLNQLGIGISIDDFGTGFSSFGHLKKLPVDEIKIDASYVNGMVVNPEDSIIVRSMINLGHNLELQVAAEGVENEETWKQLSEYGCDAVQGYYISRPVPASELARWL